MPITYPPEVLTKVRTVTNADATLTPGDVVVEVDSASAQTVTIPAGSFSVGRVISVRRLGAGSVTLVADTGVTLRLPGTHTAALNGQYATATVHQRAADEWVAAGDLA